MSNQLINDLRATKETILRLGWTKHTYQDSINRVCIAGGATLGICKSDLFTSDLLCDSDTHKRLIAISRAIKDTNNLSPEISISQWNDAPETTIDDVIKLIDNTIVYLQEQFNTIEDRELVAA